MLADDILELEKEMPDGLEEQQGACRFCGQIRMLHTMGMMKEELLNEAATQLCDCPEADKYARHLRKKEKAYERIRSIYHDMPEDIQELMGAAVDLMLEDRMEKVTLHITGKLKAQISMTSKGNIKIDRTETRKSSTEA